MTTTLVALLSPFLSKLHMIKGLAGERTKSADNTAINRAENTGERRKHELHAYFGDVPIFGHRAKWVENILKRHRMVLCCALTGREGCCAPHLSARVALVSLL